MALDYLSRFDNAREVAPIAPASFIPVTELRPMPVKSDDSIATATTTVFPKRHRPVLEQPKCVLLELIELHQGTEKLDARRAAYFRIEITQNSAEMERISAEKFEMLKAEAKAAQSKSAWHALFVVGQYISSVSIFVLGNAIGGPAGGCLIGAGVFGLGGRVVRDTNLLERELATKIETGAFFLEMGLGLAGGAIAWKTGAFAMRGDAMEMMRTAASNITIASGIMTATARVGTAFHDKNIASFRAKIKGFEGDSTIAQQSTTQVTASLSHMIEAGQGEIHELHTAIKTLDVVD